MNQNKISELGRRYYRYYAGRIARDLCMKLKRIPDFEIGNDRSAWTGNVDGREVIHIGLGLMDKHPDGTEVCKDENDFHMLMRHLQGHECGHQKYTTKRAFEMALFNGVSDFIEYAYAQVAGVRIHLTKAEDHEKALRDLDKNYGVRITLPMIQQFVHFVANSIEDGRMERLCAKEKPGFGYDVVACRADEWMHSGIMEVPNLNDPREYVLTVMNQILTLATTGLWQKGFDEYLAETQVEADVKNLLPDIKAGVLARNCASGMRYADKINHALYPMFLKACQMTDMEKALSDFVQSVMSQLPDMDPNGNNPHSYNASEKEDAGREKEAQGVSSESEEGQDGGFNIFVQAKEDSQDEGTGSGSGSGEGTEESKEDSEASDSIGSGKGTMPGSDRNGDQHGQSSEESTRNGELHPGGRSGSKGQSVDENADDDADMVREAMKKATEEGKTQTEIAQEQTTMAEAVTAKKPETKDNSLAEENAGSMRDICRTFNEFLREYEVDDDLPLFIEQECELTRKKYEEYFKSRRKPRRRNQRSGRFDAHGLSRLLRGDTDVYMRPGDDDSFSGCIEIRLDNSGSMADEKRRYACEALARIEENLKGLVPLKITAFDSSNKVNVEIIKNWNEDLRKNCSWNFNRYGRFGGGTPTTEALLTAERELLARTEKHKLLVLLTDENAYCCSNTLPETIAKIRKSGIQLCGIYFDSGITEADKESFYSLFDHTDAIACDPENISRELLPVIRKFTEQ